MPQDIFKGLADRIAYFFSRYSLVCSMSLLHIIMFTVHAAVSFTDLPVFPGGFFSFDFVIFSLWASTTAISTILKIVLTELPSCSTCTGFFRPSRIGPTLRPLPVPSSGCRQYYPLPGWGRSGYLHPVHQFTEGIIFLHHFFIERHSGLHFAIHNQGWAFLILQFLLALRPPVLLPVNHCCQMWNSSAWRSVGMILNCLTSRAASRVISASSSAVGLKFTVVSARNSGPFLVSIMYIPAIFCTPSSVPIV